MNFIGLLPVFSKNVRKSLFFSSLAPFRSKPVSLIIEGILSRCLSVFLNQRIVIVFLMN